MTDTATINAPWYQDTAFFNTSYFIDMSSAACPHGAKSGFSHLAGECTVNSTGFPHGTIYYAWRLGLPEFPYPATAAIAQALPPSDVTPGAGPLGTTNATLDWMAPPGESDPIINWTLAWSRDSGPTTYVPLTSSTLSYEVTGLTVGDLLSYSVEAWNLHWHGACEEASWVVGSPSAPTDLTTVSQTSSSVTLAWSNPSGDLVNDSVYFGPAGCAGPWTGRSTGGVASSATVSGLSSNTSYCFRVTAWNLTGQSSPSAPLIASTLVSLPMTYSVSFLEAGLPSGLPWTVTCNGVQASLTTDGATDNLTFLGLPNGTHAYLIADISGWHQTTLPYSGDVNVTGASVVESTLVFAQVTYNITFTETGLSVGTEWWVNLTNGQTFDSLTGSLLFVEPNATYDFTVATANPEYESAGGAFPVDGAVVAENVDFILTYTVTFTESGLPNGTPWYLNVTDGVTHRSTGSTISITEPNGTYEYTVATTDKEYAPVSANGSFGVRGAPVSEPVTFDLVTNTVTFLESGAPGGTEWWVNVTGQPTQGSTTATITLGLPNGTYTYVVATADKSYRSPGRGIHGERGGGH